jgi:hypothetical protein
MLLLLGALGLAIAGRLSFLALPFRDDAGVYVAMGRAVVEGWQLYVDVWEQKPPGVAALLALFYSGFGHTWWPYVFVQLAAGLLVPVLLTLAVQWDRLGRPTVPTQRPLATDHRTTNFLALALLAFNCPRILITGFQLETIMCLLTTAGACCFLAACSQPKSRAFAGFVVFAVVAALIKPTALSLAGAGCLALMVRPLPSSTGVVGGRVFALIGGLAVLGLVLLAQVALASWLQVEDQMLDLWREISSYGSGTPWSQIFQFKTLVFLGLTTAPALLAIAVLWQQRGSDQLEVATIGDRANAADGEDTRPAIFAASWLILELVGVMLQKRVYSYHFLVLVPPSLLLFGVLVRSPLNKHLQRAFYGVIGVLAAVGAFSTYNVARTHDPQERIVHYLKTHLRSGEAIFADPLGEFLARTSALPGARLLMAINMINHDAATERWTNQVLADFEKRKPRFIILQNPAMLEERVRSWEAQPVLALNPGRAAAHRDAWRRIVENVKQHYAVAADIDGRLIYERILEPEAAPAPR